MVIIFFKPTWLKLCSTFQIQTIRAFKVPRYDPSICPPSAFSTVTSLYILKGVFALHVADVTNGFKGKIFLISLIPPTPPPTKF